MTSPERLWGHWGHLRDVSLGGGGDDNPPPKWDGGVPAHGQCHGVVLGAPVQPALGQSCHHFVPRHEAVDALGTGLGTFVGDSRGHRDGVGDRRGHEDGIGDRRDMGMGLGTLGTARDIGMGFGTEGDVGIELGTWGYEGMWGCGWGHEDGDMGTGLGTRGNVGMGLGTWMGIWGTGLGT